MSQLPPVGPTGLQRRTYRVWFLVGLAVLAWVSWAVLAPILTVIVPPAVVGAAIVYILNPLVTSLEHAGLPRWLGTAVSYLLLATVIVIPLTVALPALARQVTQFVEEAPTLATEAATDLEVWLGGVGIEVQLDDVLAPDNVTQNLEQFFSDEASRSAVAAIIGGLSGLATGLFRFGLTTLVGPVVAFYVLVDLPRFGSWIRRHLPPSHRDELGVLAGNLTDVIGGYLRGQLLVATFVGCAASLGLWLVDLPFWLVVGIIAGATNLIPLLGPLVAGAIGVIIALVTNGPGLALLVLIVLTVVQQLDNHVISPLVMGRSVRLHPVLVLSSLLVAGSLYGLLGLVIAVPITAAAKVAASHVWQTRVPWAVPEAGSPILPSELRARIRRHREARRRRAEAAAGATGEQASDPHGDLRSTATTDAPPRPESPDPSVASG